MAGFFSLNILLIVLVFVAVDAGDSPTVVVPKLGTIVGLNMDSFSTKRPYSGFLGIPYAQPISPETRFQPSLPAKPFTGTFYATTYGTPCRQSLPTPEVKLAEHLRKKMDVSRTKLEGSPDDCLVLSVFTPKIPTANAPKKDLLPVLFFIHGGGFTTGEMFIYDADRIMENDVVLVTIQYRLGPTGFLCLQVPEIPGNAGLYDQILALEWVRNYITPFGGDPDRITINGQSAGSVSVSTLAVSNYNNLFTQVIAQSGSVLAPWGIDDDPVRHATGFAELLNCTDPDHSKIATCLMGYSDDVLSKYFTTYTYQMRKNGESGFGGTTPCVQQYAGKGREKVLDMSPIAILNDPKRQDKMKHLKFMFGTTQTEGSFVMAIIYNQYMIPNHLTHNTTFFKGDFGSFLLNTVDIYDPTGALSLIVVEDFMDPKTRGNLTAMMPSLVDMMGVLFMKGGCYKTMQYHAALNDAYWYSFEYQGEYSQLFWSIQFGSLDVIPVGVTHGEELIYLYLPVAEFPLDSEESLLATKLAKLWTNFVIYGEPTPKNVPDALDFPTWDPYSPDTNSFMRIYSPRNFSIETNYPSLWHITREISLDGQCMVIC